MAAPVADLVRSAQPKSGPLAPSAPAPKSTRRFDDVLASRREQAHSQSKPQPKAEVKPHGHDARGTKSDKAARRDSADARKVDSNNQADNAEVADTERSDMEAAHEDRAAESTQSAKPAKKPAAVKKSDDHAEAETTDATAEPTAEAGPAGQAAAIPAEIELAVEVKTEHSDESPDTTKSTADASIDPAAFAAQLNAAPTPVADPTTASASDVSTQTADVATAPVASTTKPTAHDDATAAALGEPAAAVEGEDRPTLKAKTEAVPTGFDDEAAAIALPDDVFKIDSKLAATDAVDSAAAALQAITPHEKPATHASMPAVPPTASDAMPKTVAEHNVDNIVSSVRGELLTKGGTMQIRLDPPSLGAINVQISVDDGVMTASLQTTNDEATRLLSHNLSQLKSQLESTGVTIDHISVKQAAPAEQSSASSQQGDGGERQSSRETGQDQSARQEQQRRDMLARMWAKLSGNGDPLDLVA